MQLASHTLPPWGHLGGLKIKRVALHLASGHFFCTALLTRPEGSGLIDKTLIQSKPISTQISTTGRRHSASHQSYQ